jgi:ATP phosphoribosyltransferase
MVEENDIVIALPKGRILEDITPILKKAGIEAEDDFYSSSSRKLSFATNLDGVKIIRVRSFDAATFVAYGAAQIGIAGSDVLDEFDYSDLYVPLDLDVGKCRMAIAAPVEVAEDKDFMQASHLRIATKYPNITKKFFAAKGVQAECVKLNGAMELAPKLGLCRRIVDLVSTGATLKANGLVEIETISEVSSRLVVNKPASKTRGDEINALVKRFEDAVNG